MDDEALLEAWIAGDRAASETLIRRHYRSVFLFLANKVGETTAADLAQSTFETLCAKRVSFRGDSSVRTYLFGIARWKLVEHLRRASGRSFDPVDESIEIQSVTQTLTSLFADRERESLVVKALRSLSLDDQIIIELKDYEGMTSRELAAMFDVPRNTMSGRVTRARERLTRRVQELSDNPRLVESTLSGLDDCMRQIRARISS